jgi:N-acetylglutamate synthase-like GNAT family acetyltransferase
MTKINIKIYSQDLKDEDLRLINDDLGQDYVLDISREEYIENELRAEGVGSSIFNYLANEAVIHLPVIKTWVIESASWDLIKSAIIKVITYFRNKTKDKDSVVVFTIEKDRKNNFPLKVIFIYDKSMSKDDIKIANDQLPGALDIIKHQMKNITSCEIASINFSSDQKSWDMQSPKFFRNNHGETNLEHLRKEKLYGLQQIRTTYRTMPSDKVWQILKRHLTQKEIETGQNLKIDSYRRLYGSGQIIEAFNKFPGATVSIEIFSSFLKPDGGVIPIPNLGEDRIGVHTIALTGLVDGVFKFKNNWGDNWGESSFGYITKEYLDKYMLDAWQGSVLILGNKLEQALIKKFYLRGKRKKDYYSELIKIEMLVSSSGDFYSLNISDPVIKNKYIGWTHFYHKKNSIEIEELYIEERYRDRHIGSSLIKKIEDFARSKKVTEIFGWVNVQDVKNLKEEKYIQDFFQYNGFAITKDNTRFKGSIYKFSKII